MNPIVKIFKKYSTNARKTRAEVFKSAFVLSGNEKILDIGSETGSNIHSVLKGTCIKPENIYIADINPVFIAKGNKKYGYVPVLINESGKLPFDDNFFDIVYCSSVIEHVTLPKSQIGSFYSGRAFRRKSLQRQKEFAGEIQRLGNQFFVQTPNRYFPIESHTWLPFLSWIPRSILVCVLKISNRIWVKKTISDWNLLSRKEMSEFFKNAKIVNEKSFGLTKSIMAIKSAKNGCNY